jgi:large subunit ribosomal protein L25
MVAFDHDAMYHNLQAEAFHTSILTLKLDGGTDQVVLRDYQMHPFKPHVLHVDLQRISATEKIHMSVPLHFVGQDVAPGVKQQGGIVSHLMTEVDVTCLPHQLPEGVQITTLAHGGDDLAVATITAVREVEEAPAEAAAGEAGAAATPAAAAPAAGEGKKEGK